MQALPHESAKARIERGGPFNYANEVVRTLELYGILAAGKD